MNLEIQQKIKSNIYYKQYLRENSIWYKYLYLNPSLFKQFEEEVKAYYHLRTSDKISKALSTIELIQNVVTNLK